MNNILKISLLNIITFLPIITLASDPKVKLKGSFDFQSIYYNNNSTADTKKVSGEKKNFGFNSLAQFNAKVENDSDLGFTYGANIGLETTARNHRKSPSYIYLSSDDYGKIELGSEKSANAKMKITAFSVSSATAGAWDVWPKFSSRKEVEYIANFGNFLDQKTREGGKVEYSRKITYYTPEIYGLQAGISYIPDTSNVGYDSASNSILHAVVKPSDYKFAIRDGIAYGLTKKFKVNKDLEIKASVVGERGKAVAKHTEKPIHQETKTDPIPKFRSLSTYTIGTEINYRDFSVAASYGNYMKSLTSPLVDKTGRSTDLHAVGAKYKFNEKLESSINYFTSSYKKNKLNAVTLAVDYKIASGLLPYAELTYYKTKGRFLNKEKNNNLEFDKTRGTVAIIGTKIEF